jgi:hypothetical protein
MAIQELLIPYHRQPLLPLKLLQQMVQTQQFQHPIILLFDQEDSYFGLEDYGFSSIECD